MKTLSLISTMLLVMYTSFVSAQESENKERYKVKLKPNKKIIRVKLTPKIKFQIPKNERKIEITKMVKITQEIKLPPGTIVEGEFKEKLKDTTYTIKTKQENLHSMPVEKAIPLDMGFMQGKATLTFSEDKSYIQVNYWREGNKVKLNSGQIIAIIKRKPDSKSEKMNPIDFGTKENPTYKYRDNELRKLSHDTTLFMTNVLVTNDKTGKIEHDERNQEWFKQSPTIIVLFNEDKSIKSIFAEKYDNEGDYRITSENREYLTIPHWESKVGLITIPFRYRPGFEKNGIKVADDFSANLNIGPFVGYSRHKLRLRYERDEYVRLPKRGVTLGAFLNVGTAIIDSLSSTVGRRQFSEKEKATIGIISPGFGIMGTLNDVNIGLFGGWDVGFGSEAKNWNYNNRFWIGFGLNYSITQLFSGTSGENK